MAINYDSNQGANVVVIEGITCNCQNKQHKQSICKTIASMNSDENICRERKAFNNQNIPSYDWSLETKSTGDGLKILYNDKLEVTINSQSKDFAQLYQVFFRQINEGKQWCRP